MHDHTELTTHEHVRFPDGDHVIVHSSPGGVQVTGMLGGEYVEYAGSARDAQEQARLLETGSPDALWTLAPEHAHRIAKALDGAAGVLADSGERGLWDLATDPDVPTTEVLGRLEQLTDEGRISNTTPADGRVSNASCDGSERVALDNGHADVETIGEHVEVTVSIGGRAGFGIGLSAVEADRIGAALRAAAHRAHAVQAAQIDLEDVQTVTDLFRRSQESGVPASALVEVIDR